MRNYFILLLVVMLAGCGPNLQETGIPTEGTVLSKRDVGLGRNAKYYITVGYFTQPDKENPQSEKKKDSPRTVDDIINDLGIHVQIGDYITAEMAVSGNHYGEYNEGDYVNLRYEKGNPTNVVIEEK